MYKYLELEKSKRTGFYYVQYTRIKVVPITYQLSAVIRNFCVVTIK